MAIFKTANDSETQEAPSAPRVSPTQSTRPNTNRTNNVSVIGPTMVFKGELSADEDLIIEGLVEGTIAQHQKHLTVGAKGRVKADIHASTVIILGQLVGDIHSEGMVELAKGADVTGNIKCGRIIMQDGARFKGNIDMDEQPKVSVVPKDPTAEPAQRGKPRKLGPQPVNN